MKSNRPFGHLWGKPFLLGIITLIGLISALVGDQTWDVLSWLLLVLPVALIAFYLYKAKI